MRNRIHTLVIITLSLFVSLICYIQIDEQRGALRSLGDVASSGASEQTEFERLVKVYDPVISKEYFQTADFKEFSSSATTEQLAAYFGPGRTSAEKTAIDGFWIPGFKDKAKTYIETTQESDRRYSEIFPTLITMSTVATACAGNRFTDEEWLAEYDLENPDVLDQLRAKVQAEIQRQTTPANCKDIESGKEGSTSVNPR